MRELLGVDRKGVYWCSGGAGVQELDRAAANAVLARTGVQLKSRPTASERTMAVTVEPGRVVRHHLFWLIKTTPPGVIDEDAAEDPAEDQPGTI